MLRKWKFGQMKVFLPLFDSIPNVLAEVVVKRDRKRCWDVMENMKHQGLPPNNVTCRTRWVNGGGW